MLHLRALDLHMHCCCVMIEHKSCMHCCWAIIKHQDCMYCCCAHGQSLNRSDRLYEPAPFSPSLLNNNKVTPLSPLLRGNHEPGPLSPSLLSSHEPEPLSPSLLSSHEPAPLSPSLLSSHEPPPDLAASRVVGVILRVGRGRRGACMSN